MNDHKVYFQKPEEGGVWDVAVIGSGPSGLTAAIYTTRGAVSTIVFAGSSWGGQLMLTTEVDNFPGFPEGVMGPDLMKNMRDQVVRFGAEIIDSDVSGINLKSNPFEISSNNKVFKAKSIIIATGAQTAWLNVPGEDKFRGRGVSSCAPCDAPFFKDKIVAVVGGGDSAMEEACVLTKYAKKTILIHRRNEFRASKVMQEKVFALEKEGKIGIIFESEITQMLGEQLLSSVQISTSNNQGKKYPDFYGGKLINEDVERYLWELPLSGIFVAIGHYPSSEIFKDQIQMDKKGNIMKVFSCKCLDSNGEGKCDCFQSATSVDGVFVAGDVADTTYKQAITAAGFGCMAGMDVLKYLDKESPSY